MAGRNVVVGAWEASQSLIDKAVEQAMTDGSKPREREVLDRYRQLHRGNALAMADYVRREVAKKAQPGQKVDLLGEMHRYEQAMRALERKYGVRGGR